MYKLLSKCQLIKWTLWLSWFVFIVPSNATSKWHYWLIWYHSDSFIGLAVPHLGVFLIIDMMPPEMWVATEIDLTVLFKNESPKKSLIMVIAASLLPPPLAAPRWLCIHLEIWNFPYEVISEASFIEQFTTTFSDTF